MPDPERRLRWAPAARQDLREIWNYYADIASTETADSLLRRITEAGLKAAERPFLRRPRDNLMPGMRAVLVHPYAVFYLVKEHEVEIVRVLHERRDLVAAFKRNDPEG